MSEQFLIVARQYLSPPTVFWIRIDGAYWQVTGDGTTYTLIGGLLPNGRVYVEIESFDSDQADALMTAAQAASLTMPFVRTNTDAIAAHKLWKRTPPAGYMMIVPAVNAMLERVRLNPGREDFTITCWGTPYEHSLKRYVAEHDDVRWVNHDGYWFFHRDDVRTICFLGVKGNMAEIIHREQ